MRISRSEPMATSKRVTNAAPLRQRFSLAVSSSKGTPRESRPRTRIGRRTEILRSERLLETDVLLGGSMGWVLISRDRRAVHFFFRAPNTRERGGPAPTKALLAFRHPA